MEIFTYLQQQADLELINARKYTIVLALLVSNEAKQVYYQVLEPYD
jgi:hypothetical protein